MANFAMKDAFIAPAGVGRVCSPVRSLVAQVPFRVDLHRVTDVLRGPRAVLLETKVEAAAPQETAPREVAPWIPAVALTQPEFLQAGQPGKSPQLGGLDIDDFGGSPVRAVKSFGASALSPVHGNPQGGKVGDLGYRPFTTKALVDEAHRAGIKVVPWTIDDPATMNKLVDDGVDGIITDYPDRLREVAAARGFKLPKAYPAR